MRDYPQDGDSKGAGRTKQGKENCHMPSLLIDL
nr:MAG TPA: hypothetical protein [Caudoviricetes sp.]